ncbi:hypothetical protein OIU77_004638 [Salix suchowensis]|uniref:Uncharacterized protein n=1 Tax=Salix suchowensis TaxID=1278906 RepID=A0ABQ9AV39_9ROSI|nr:hypothetical protein OIU77_004638 [Salix suchowensis]
MTFRVRNFLIFFTEICRILSFKQRGPEDLEAKVMHRGTSKVISVATTNAKDLRHDLPSLTDHNACRIVGKLIAERSKEADVYAMSYEPRKDERIEGFVVVNDVGTLGFGAVNDIGIEL